MPLGDSQGHEGSNPSSAQHSAAPAIADSQSLRATSSSSNASLPAAKGDGVAYLTPVGPYGTFTDAYEKHPDISSSPQDPGPHSNGQYLDAYSYSSDGNRYTAESPPAYSLLPPPSNNGGYAGTDPTIQRGGCAAAQSYKSYASQPEDEANKNQFPAPRSSERRALYQGHTYERWRKSMNQADPKNKSGSRWFSRGYYDGSV